MGKNKIWLAPYTGIKLYLPEGKRKGFEECDKYVLMCPDCQNCSWNSADLVEYFAMGYLFQRQENGKGLERG